MQHNPLSRKLIFAPAILLLTGITFCNFSSLGSQSTPTMNVTQAYQTVEARLTHTVDQTPQGTDQAAASPTSTPEPSSTPNQTLAPTRTALPATVQPTAQNCDRAAAGNPIDVTIPDDSPLLPGQAFTKIWRLVNAGTCSWTSQYAVTYFSGEQMGAPAVVPLSGEVKPGQTVDISVDMVAPQQSGKYQGNWKLRNASSVLFGIGPGASSPFWVRIVVESTPTASPTAGTPTPTTTPTTTSVPIHGSGRVTLNVGNRIDLDSLGVNSGSGEDLSYESNVDGQHPLIPVESVLIGRYGTNEPTLELCQNANLSDAPVIVESVPVGSYLCYRTNQGLPGWARLTALNIDNYQLTLDLLTWSLP